MEPGVRPMLLVRAARACGSRPHPDVRFSAHFRAILRISERDAPSGKIKFIIYSYLNYMNKFLINKRFKNGMAWHGMACLAN